MENISEKDKQEINKIMGQPCPNCGSYNIWVHLKDGRNLSRGGRYSEDEVEYTFCNMCDKRL